MQLAGAPWSLKISPVRTHRIPMRILHFVQGRCSLDSSNGVDKTVYFLARAEAEAGGEIGIFCISEKSIRPVPGVDVRNFAPMTNPFIVRHQLSQAAEQWRPDFIHLHCPYQLSNIPLARLARRLRVPYAITAHGNLSPRLLRRRPLLKVPYKLLFDAPLFNRAAFVHAIADKDDIIAYGVHRPIVVAPNGFEARDLPRPVDPEIALQRFPELREKDVALFLGRLDIGQKGLDLLVDAFAEARRRHPRLHLALAGPDWKGSLERLRQRVSELGLGDAVTFCGPVTGDGKFHLMAAAGFFVHPSRWEAGIPFSVLEALAVGVPCLLSEAADPGRLTERADAGFVTSTEPEPLAGAIERLAETTAGQRARMADQARELIATEFTWNKTAATLLDAYRRFV